MSGEIRSYGGAVRGDDDEPIEQIVRISGPYLRHVVDELENLGGGQMRAADEKSLSEAGVRGLLRGDGENARVGFRVTAVAILTAVDTHAAVVDAKADGVQVPVDVGHRVGAVGRL